MEIIDLPSNIQDEYYINKAITWVNKEFPNNIGYTNNFIFPITHKTANKWLTHFLQNNFIIIGPNNTLCKVKYYEWTKL